ACDNSDLRDAACLGKAWMHRYPGGAVAHYGASRPSSTQDNDILEDSLFVAVWNDGMTQLGPATTWAEDQSIAWKFGWAVPNAWIYTLFGDPEMAVRRAMPPSWTKVVPNLIVRSINGGTRLDLEFHEADGAPLVGALVGIWKPMGPVPAAAKGTGVTDANDDVADNRYTASDGHARFTISPVSDGYLYYTVRDSAGNSLTDSIAVTESGAVPPPSAGEWRFTASPRVTTGSTRLSFGRPLDHPAVL